ncbi:MAG: molybdopterin biosynthesis protein [Planctomycetota bacterium]|nr:molybdopterin biosynthesis protein [Planctomycetota bacterium]
MKPEVRQASRQEQFLDVIDRDEATRRFHEHLDLRPLGSESVPLHESLQRVLAGDVVSDVDVTAFDRSNVDGFAVCSVDTIRAMEETPRLVQLNDEVLSPGVEPRMEVLPGFATPIATGAMLPRGADAVVMIEHTELIETDAGPRLEIRRSVSPGQSITYAGTDIARGETTLRIGQRLTSREIGVLAAIGRATVDVFRKPRVGVISTGDEIIAPGKPLRPGTVYDSNAAILAAAIRELGGEPRVFGIAPDDLDDLQTMLDAAMACDLILMSGGTSKGAGDLSYRVVSKLNDPGIVAHGVALKPGKPICLAVTRGKPVVILPGFPTSAIFTFHEFVAPVIRAFAGQPAESQAIERATLPMRFNSERGRTEYLLVGLVRSGDGSSLAAYPMGKGSGSVTTFSGADGFVTIDQHTEIVEAGSVVDVQLLGRSLRPADLVVIGSHCTGLDVLLSETIRRGFSVKSMHVGSMGGLTAAKRAECDIAGMHLLHAQSGEYNRPFLSDDLELLTGYRRMQGIVFRPDDSRFAGRTKDEAIAMALEDPECAMVNRNAGSGTRVLIDGLLGETRPRGFAVQTKSHNAVAAAVVQGRADWGVAISNVAEQYDLSFIPLQEEHYDFVVPRSRLDQPAVIAFRELLADDSVRRQLVDRGFRFRS